jgi:FkbM family methyltransferase
MSEPRITREHIIWAYRLLLDRDPEGDAAILPKLGAWATTRELRADLMASEEFRLKNPDHAASHAPRVVIKPLADGARLFIDLADHVIGLGILRDGYEQDELGFALRVLGPGDVAIDVGAHIGFFTIHMAQTVGEQGMVYAFEPLDRNADLLAASIAESGFGVRVTLDRAAVSDRAGAGTLRYARETLNTGGAFVSDAVPAGLAGLAATTVRTVCLDDLAMRRPVRLIKIDVEGGEPRVIAGASNLISADKPVIVSEIHPEQLARVSHVGPAAFFEQLARLGLRPHRISAAGLGQPVAASEITGIVTLAFVPADAVLRF